MIEKCCHCNEEIKGIKKAKLWNGKILPMCYSCWSEWIKGGKITRMINKIKKWFGSLMSGCYEQREYEGYASMGCCGGLTGGDKTTGYLQYECIECPHFVNLE